MKLIISRIELVVLLFSLAVIPHCYASEADDRIEQDRAEGKAKVAQFIISNGSLAMKSIPNRYKLPFWALGAGAYKLHDEFQNEHLDERKNRFIPARLVQPLASKIQAIDLEGLLMRAEKASKYQFMQNAAMQAQRTRVFKDEVDREVDRMVTIQIVDNSVQQTDNGKKISLADLMQRKTLVYKPEDSRVETAHNFNGTVQVSGGQIAAVGDDSFLVGLSPQIAIHGNGQDAIVLYPKQPVLLLGTEFELGDETCSLQENSIRQHMPKLF